MANIGTCALCGDENVAIERSHILPAWSYERVSRYSPGRSEPVLVTEDVALQTSEQVRRPLLCRKCEQRFSDHEKVVARWVVQEDGSFPLLGQAREVEKDVAVEISEEAARALSYFGTSVIWRADVAQIEPVVSLGSARKQTRAFLLGESAPPAVMVLTLLRPPRGHPRMDRVVSFPESSGGDSDARHEFVCCGVRFSYIVGETASFDAVDAFNKRLAFVSAGHSILQSVADRVSKVTMKGKLAAKHE